VGDSPFPPERDAANNPAGRVQWDRIGAGATAKAARLGTRGGPERTEMYLDAELFALAMSLRRKAVSLSAHAGRAGGAAASTATEESMPPVFDRLAGNDPTAASPNDCARSGAGLAARQRALAPQ
jgi:hypothetical protein